MHRANGRPTAGTSGGLGDGGERLHDWMLEGRTADQARAFEESIFAPVGAMVMGRRMHLRYTTRR